MARTVLLLIAFLVTAIPSQATPIVVTAELSGLKEAPTNGSSGVTSGVYDGTFDMLMTGSYRPSWLTDSRGTLELAEVAPTVISEPASLLILSFGLAAAGLLRRYRS